LGLVERLPLVTADVLLEVRRGIAVVVPNSGVERDGVGAVGQLLAVDPDPEASPELLADLFAQGFPPLVARDGDLVGRRPRGVHELQEEGAVGRSAPLNPELSRHGGREADAVRVDLLASATRYFEGGVRQEALAERSAPVGETISRSA